jgi:hypothetical protein
MVDHIVVLGWTNRTPEVIRRLLGARGRLVRFLSNRHARKLRVVLLSEDSGAERRQELREHLGEHWNESMVFLRSGSSLQGDHLERLDILRASVILIPGADFELGGAEMTDTRVIKTLMTVNRLLRDLDDEERPGVVAEIFDPRKVSLARNSFDSKLEVVASNRIISRLISQSVRHRGMAQILFGLFSHRQGNSLYLRDLPELTGHDLRSAAGAFDAAVVVGFLSRVEGETRIVMDPCDPQTLGPEDLLILLAESYDQCQPGRAPRALAPCSRAARPESREVPVQTLLVLGWSHKLGALITELDQSGTGRFAITIMSRVDLAEREHWMKRIAFDAARIGAENVIGDYSIESDLAGVRPADFDHVIMMASDWMDSSEAADARTILGYALLTSLLKQSEHRPEILVELLDPDNSSLFAESDDVILVTPRVLSHILAHVALRPELNTVYDELFGAGGSEIALRPADEYGLVGREVHFAEIQEAVFTHGVTALGLLCRGGKTPGIHLNRDRGRSWTLSKRDDVAVIAKDSDDLSS